MESRTNHGCDAVGADVVALLKVKPVARFARNRSRRPQQTQMSRHTTGAVQQQTQRRPAQKTKSRDHVVERQHACKCLHSEGDEHASHASASASAAAAATHLGEGCCTPRRSPCGARVDQRESAHGPPLCRWSLQPRWRFRAARHRPRVRGVRTCVRVYVCTCVCVRVCVPILAVDGHFLTRNKKD